MLKGRISMNILDYCHANAPKIDKFIPRKSMIPPKGNINLYGVRGSGKTSIAIDSMQEILESVYLYIDARAPHFIFEPLNLEQLQRYITDHSIEVLLLDHYEKAFLPQLPKVNRTILITRTAMNNTLFQPIELYPLDYEEFLAFESNSIHKGFNHFLRSGTLAPIARQTTGISQHMQTFFYAHFDAQEQKLLLLLAEHHTQHLTTNQIYAFSKEKFKISKDWLYKTMASFVKEKVVHFIEDSYQKSGKKMLLFDFALAKHLTLNQPFIVQFDSMIALTLIKHGIAIKTLGIHGYITQEKELIIASPFESEESLWLKSQKKFSLYKQYGILKVTIITVSNHYEYAIEKIHFEALPFDEWSVSHSEI